jgi:hypothetical protein
MSDGLVSVIIPCREIDAMTQRCIDACRQSAPDAHLVVVAESPPASPPSGVRILPSPATTPAAARNRAVATIATPFIALIDSDAYPQPGWPAPAIAILQQDPRIGAVGGPCLSPPDEPLPERVVGNASRSVLVSGLQTFRHRRAPARDCPHLSSCNLVLRRQDFLAVGGMDQNLYTGEDNDLGARLRRHGLRVRFDPSIVVYHRNRTWRGLFFQRFVWGFDAAETMLNSRFRSLPQEALSAAWLMFLCLGIVWMWWPAMRGCYLTATGVYLAVCLAETLRTCGRRSRAWPGTLRAILVGNLAPGLGLLARLAGISLDRRRWYRNVD